MVRRTKGWSAEEKRSVCRQTTAPGASLAQVAGRYSLNPSRMQALRAAMQDSGAPPAAEAPARATRRRRPALRGNPGRLPRRLLACSRQLNTHAISSPAARAEGRHIDKQLELRHHRPGSHPLAAPAKARGMSKPIARKCSP
ncbi:transposase [Amaricoccus macauensis]|uniref:transposase n=1 Tax=Amaricoccus macauensis TaxID=57001 RepID=UPI0016180394|nr:transposase [Amaricoccus macauensis]